MTEHSSPEDGTTRRRVLGVAALSPVIALATTGIAHAAPGETVERAARPQEPECIADLAGEL